MTTESYEYLRRNGPATMGEMPRDKLSIEDKQAGIWKFYGNWSSIDTARPGGTTATVFYIRHLHTPRQVVRAWIHANEHAVENLPRRSLIAVLNRNGSEFEEPIQTLLDQIEA